jgi:ATP-dependent DNA helicase PIF1
MFPFQFKRKQFPIKLSFAMTVNKSQGQTIPNVGVYPPAPVFSLGQLYVVMSRATSRTNIKIIALLPDAEAQEEEAKKKERKKYYKGCRAKKYKNASNKKDKDKKTPVVNGTFTKNIVFKEVLMP